MTSKDLDTSIGNLHKALANHATPNRIVRLNAVKCIILYSICRHFGDRIKCDAPLEADEIVALTYDDIQTMRKHYLESEQAKTTKGLSSVEMKKLSPLK